MAHLRLVMADGPRKGEERTVRDDGSTMADMSMPDPETGRRVWFIYDQKPGETRIIQSVTLRETGETDHLGRHIVEETSREQFDGVL